MDVGFVYRKTRRYGLGILLLVAVCLTNVVNPYKLTFAQESKLNIKNLSVENGLSHSTAHHIMQDRHGFIWISTRDGLSRYNGQQFEIFKHEPGNPNSLSANTVWCTMEDGNGLIWIGTNGGGLNIYNPKEDKFYQFSVDSNNKSSISSNTITSLFEDDQGTVWVGTDGGGLNKVVATDLKSEAPSIKFKRYLPDEENSESISHSTIMQITQDRSGYIWLATYGGGVNRMNIEKETFKTGFDIGGQHVMSLVVKNDLLWAGTKYNGLSLLDLERDSLYRFYHEEDRSDTISENFVWSTFIDDEGTIWVGTFGGGLNTISYEQNQESFDFSISQYQTGSESSGYIGNYISHIHEDSEGRIWLATDHSGVSILQKNIPFKKPELKIADTDVEIENITFNDFLTTENGDTWIGTSVGLLYRPGDSAKARFVSSDNHTKVINSIEQIDNGKILVGTNIGLYQVADRMSDNPRLISLSFPLSYGGTSVDLVWDIVQDQQHFIWLSTNTGLWKLDKTLKPVDRYYDEQNKQRSLSSNNTGTLFLERDTLWIATSTGGLNKLDLMNDTVERYVHDRKKDNTIGSNKVLNTYRDQTGQLWVATYGGGLNKFIYRNQKSHFEKFLKKDGLPDNTVKDLAEDEAGNLWITTQYGLAHMDIENEDIVPIFIPDHSNRNLNKIFTFSDSTFVLTSSSGYRLFNPADFNSEGQGLPLRITNVQVLNENYQDSRSPHELEKVELRYDQNYLTIEFSLLDYFSSDFANYQYKMEGLDPQWINAGQQGKVNYSALPAGDYIFRAKATGYDGIAAKNEIALAVTVLPPYWQTWWFLLAVLLTATGSLYGLYRYRINTLMKVQRTRQRIARDLHDEVSATLSSITYFSEAVYRETQNETSKKYLTLITESANETKEKITDIIWSIDPDQDDWVSLLSKCRRFASDLFESKGMEYELDIDTDIAHSLNVELRQHLWFIFKEMVVNAARHSKAERVDLFFGMQGGRLILVVQDNGIGLPDDFDKKSGQGIKNIRQRARDIGAKLILETDQDIGTRWKLFLKMK